MPRALRIAHRLPRLGVALNLGSSTLKAAWFSMGESEARSDDFALLSRIAVPLPAFREDDSFRSPPIASDETWSALLDQVAEAAPSRGANPFLVAHRIVHGGTRDAPQRLDVDARHALGALSAWAPLHQAPALALAAAASTRWPRAGALGVFDTSWHRTLAAESRTLALPGRWRAAGVERYGFHGLAFQSAYRQLCRSSPSTASAPVVLAHLGGGASLCAVRGGHSVDTTMGLTPLDGVPMATRSGSLDPGVVLHLIREAGGEVDAVEAELSGRSGLLGLSGISGDMRRLLADETKPAQLAIDVFTLRVAQGIASMATSAGGLEDLVFSGGVGSHAASVRAEIGERLAWLGVNIDARANEENATRIEAIGSRVRVWVVTVDEEWELAHAALAWQDDDAAASP